MTFREKTTLSIENLPPQNTKAYAKVCSTKLLRLREFKQLKLVVY